MARSQPFFLFYIFFYQLFLISLRYITIKDKFMTHSEDLPRFRSAEQNQDFLLFRIEALQKRIEFLEALNEVYTLQSNNQNQ